MGGHFSLRSEVYLVPRIDGHSLRHTEDGEESVCDKMSDKPLNES